MRLHLLDTNEKPIDRSIISANCGMKIKFIPECADLDGLKICKNCLKVHFSLRKVRVNHIFVLKKREFG